MSDRKAARAPLGLGLGWWVVGACTLSMSLSLPAFFGVIFAQFLPHIAKDLQVRGSEVAAVISVMTYVALVLGPVVGTLLDRFGPGILIQAGSVLFPLTLVGFSLVSSGPLSLYGTAAIVGVAAVVTLPLTYTALVLKWFDCRRGLALGVVLSGVGIAGFVIPPVFQPLIADIGWRGAIRVLALIMFLVVAPLMFAVSRLRPPAPEEIDGGRSPAGAAPARIEAVPVPWKTEATDSRMIRLAIIFVMLGFVTQALSVTLVTVLQSKGIPPMAAGRLIPVYGACLVFARVASGWLLDRFPARFVAFGMLALAALGLLVLSAGPASMAALGIALMAFGFGAEFDVMAYFLSRLFSRANYGKLYGLTFSAFLFGAGAGPPILARVAESAGGSFGPGLAAGAAIVLAAAALFLTLKTPSAAGGPQRGD